MRFCSSILRCFVGCYAWFALADLSAAAVKAAAKPKAIPLDHFVYIIQENISFDHYFGTFPGADGIPVGAKFAFQPGQPATVSPFHLHATALPHDLNHSWQAAHVAADGGKMDGFLWAEWPEALAFYWKGELRQSRIRKMSYRWKKACSNRGLAVRRRVHRLLKLASI